MIALVITGGPQGGRRFEIVRETVIGREHADIELDDTEMSRRHVTLRPLEDGLEVEDLGSRNGTFLDGARISGATRAHGGAMLKVGATTFAVEAPARAAGETRVSAPGGTELGRRPASVARPAAAAAQPAPAPSFGAFTPPVKRRRRKAATRLWIPQALTYASVLGTAAALVVYFAGR